MRLSGIYCMDGQRVGRHRVLSDVRGLTCMLCGLFRGGVRRKRKGGGGGGGGRRKRRRRRNKVGIGRKSRIRGIERGV